MSSSADRLILRGYNSQFIYLRPLETVGAARFLDGTGQPVDFSRFRGKVVLANFSATWCPPCAYEMPALDRLQAEIAGDRLAVVAIALDTAGLEAVAPFFHRQGLTHLAIYLDPSDRTVYTDAENAELRAVAARHLTDIRTKIADLHAMEQVLTDAVARCDAGELSGCPVIETLSAG